MLATANVAAYRYTPFELKRAAVGLLSLLRNEGGSVGTSMAQTLHERRDQFHTMRLGEHLEPFNATVSSFGEKHRRNWIWATRLPCSNWPGRRSKTCVGSRPPQRVRRIARRRGEVGLGGRRSMFPQRSGLLWPASTPVNAP
jgi:hypothetical protein